MIICIGKSCGSGGHEIGEQLAGHLGYAYYDQKMLEKAAAREVSENTSDVKEEMYAQLSGDVSGEIGAASETERTQFLAKSGVLLHIAAVGNCVIDMNCADHILKEAGMKHISIFITAPYEDRIARMMKELGRDSMQTAVFIKKENLRRENYYNYINGGGWGDPSNYDICINSSAHGIEKTAEIIRSMIEKL